MSKVLLIGIGFYEYENEISKEIITQGNECLIAQSKPRFLEFPLIYKFFLHNAFLRKKIISLHQFVLIHYIANNSFDKVLIINGNELPINFFKKIHNLKNKPQLFLYLWDSITRLKVNKEYFSFFTKVFSFDKKDSDANPDIFFRPLFYVNSKIMPLIPYEDRMYDITIISVANEKRLAVCKKILLAFKDISHINIKIYLYCGFSDYFRNIFTNHDRITFLKSINLNEYYKILSDSKCLVDIGHDNQTGLSMRCIEAIGGQVKLISSNIAIEEYDFYSYGNVYIDSFKDNEEIDTDYLINFLSASNFLYDQEITEYYSLYNWVSEVIG